MSPLGPCGSLQGCRIAFPVEGPRSLMEATGTCLGTAFSTSLGEVVKGMGFAQPPPPLRVDVPVEWVNAGSMFRRGPGTQHVLDECSSYCFVRERRLSFQSLHSPMQ